MNNNKNTSVYKTDVFLFYSLALIILVGLIVLSLTEAKIKETIKEIKIIKSVKTK